MLLAVESGAGLWPSEAHQWHHEVESAVSVVSDSGYGCSERRIKKSAVYFSGYIFREYREFKKPGKCELSHFHISENAGCVSEILWGYGTPVLLHGAYSGGSAEISVRCVVLR